MNKRAVCRQHASRYLWFTADNESGLTLLEMLFAVIIIGLILGFGVSAWFTMKTSQQLNSAATLVRRASTCLENYVILSGKIPPVSYFRSYCDSPDPWRNQLIYENNGDDVTVQMVSTRSFRDLNGTHPDAAWIIASTGPNGTRELVTSPALWDCSSGDDVCSVTSKNGLLYEIGK